MCHSQFRDLRIQLTHFNIPLFPSSHFHVNQVEHCPFSFSSNLALKIQRQLNSLRGDSLQHSAWFHCATLIFPKVFFPFKIFFHFNFHVLILQVMSFPSRAYMGPEQSRHGMLFLILFSTGLGERAHSRIRAWCCLSGVPRLVDLFTSRASGSWPCPLQRPVPVLLECHVLRGP